MEDKKKIEALCRKWVEWNRHEISGDGFVSAFFKLFKKETLAEWNDPLRKPLV